MKLDLDCIPCLLQQAVRATRMVEGDAEPRDVKHVLDRVMEVLLDPRLLDDLPGKTGARVYGEIAKALGTADVFLEVKQGSNETGRALYPRLKHIIAQSTEPLKTAAKIASAGNIIDFGVTHDFNVEAELDKLHLAIDDFDELQEALRRARTVLYIGDNAGEQYFDKVFIEEIKHEFGDRMSMSFGVRGGPIINDLTAADAKHAGLDALATIVAGSQSPGIILDESSDAFKAAFASADVIISKGMGNFENLTEQPATMNIFFMLKVKCHVIERLTGVPIGSSVLASWRKMSSP